MNDASPGRLRAWTLASRPKTLAAAVIPVLVGSAIAWKQGGFRVGPALAALIGAMLIQIGTNFANDYFDFVQGADTEERIGPLRAVQAGLLSPAAMKTGMMVVFAAALLVGAYLVVVGGWPILVIGLLSILSGIAYTGGPYPLGYHGLGDFFVFVFFGPVAVCGTEYVQTLAVSPASAVASIPIGALAVAILVVNNVRDIGTDAQAGKRTLPVRFGRTFGVLQYAACCLAALLAPIAAVLFGLAERPVLLCLLTLPFGLGLLRQVAVRKDGPTLNRTLARTARWLVAYGVLYSVGVLL